MRLLRDPQYLHICATLQPNAAARLCRDCSPDVPEGSCHGSPTSRRALRCVALRSAQGRCDSSPSRAGAAGPAHASAFTGTSRWGSGTFTPPTRNPGELLSYLRSLKDSSIPVKQSGHGDLIKSTSVQGQSPRDSGNLFHWGNWSSD